MKARSWIHPTLFVAALAFSACRVEDSFEIGSVDRAFAGIAKTAEENGGAAMKIRGGSDFTIKVDDPESPLNGASVRVPRGALPKTVEHAALAIYLLPEQPVVTAEDYKVVSPVATVVLVELPSADAIDPAKPLEINMPYAMDETYPAEDYVLGILENDTVPSAVTITTVHPDRKQTQGYSTKFAAVASMYQVQYDGGKALPNTLMYKVTKPDGRVACTGIVTDVHEKFTEKSYAYVDSGDFSFDLVMEGTVSSFSAKALDLDKTADSPPENYVNRPPVGGNISIGCKGNGGAADGKIAYDGMLFAVSQWEAQGSGSAATCGASACTKRSGKVTVDGQFDYTTADENGDRVQAALNATIEEFTWFTVP